MRIFSASRLTSLLLVLVVTQLLYSQPATDNPIVPPDAKLEKLFDGGMVLTEGVAVAPDGMVYFSDITFSHVSKEKTGLLEAGHILKYNPKTGKTTVFRSPSGMSNGIKFDAEGNMIVAEGADYGGRRVIKTDMKTGKSFIIAGLFEGKPFNSPNDITIDEKGRIYFSDPRYLGHEPLEQPVQAVYRIDTDGSIHRIITDAGKCNGVDLESLERSQAASLAARVNSPGSLRLTSWKRARYVSILRSGGVMSGSRKR